MSSKSFFGKSRRPVRTLHIAYSLLSTGKTSNDIPFDVSFTVYNRHARCKKFRIYKFTVDLNKRDIESWDYFWLKNNFDRNHLDSMINADGLAYLNERQKAAKNKKIKTLKELATFIHNFLFELELSYDHINLICHQKEEDSYQLSKLLESYGFPNLSYSRNGMTKKVDNSECLFFKQIIQKYHREMFLHVDNQRIFDHFVKTHFNRDHNYDFEHYFDDIDESGRFDLNVYNPSTISNKVLLDTLYALFIMGCSQYNDDIVKDINRIEVKQEKEQKIQENAKRKRFRTK